MVLNPQTLSQKWNAEGFSCDLWIDPPGQCWENYVHEVDEMVCVESGEVEFELLGKKTVLSPGQELFIPARAVHSVRNLGKTAARWYYGYRRPS